MNDPLVRMQVRAALQSLEDRYSTRDDLVRALDTFVRILIPKQHIAPVIAEEMSAMPQLHSVKSLAPYHLAAAVVLSSLQSARGTGKLVRRSWFRRLCANLNRVRLSAREIGLEHLPLLDRVEQQLATYVRALYAGHHLADAHERDMPPGLAAALAELFVEACVGYPTLAEYIVVTGLMAAEAPGSRFLTRLQQSVIAALENEPAPNDLRHHYLRIERESLVFDPSVAAESYVAPHRLVYPDEPPRFFEVNIRDSWFVNTAREAPARVRKLVAAA